ncbi:MAG: SulP family inorganic anion transporter [Planctomycetota bacterium]
MPDILSGMTVALALVPEAIAFAFIAGVDPIIGLYSAFMIGLLTSICGGRPGMISGATGAMAVVVIGLVAIYGVEYLFPTVILCGILQCLVGILRMGKLIRMVPHSVMLGFVNGLAIVIFTAQFPSFKELGEDGLMHTFAMDKMAYMLGGVALTMAIIHLLPKLTKAVPSSLAAILVVTGLAVAINASTGSDNKPFMTVSDMMLQGNEEKAIKEKARERVEADNRLIATSAVEAGIKPEDGADEAEAVLIEPDSIKAKIKAMSAEEIAAIKASVPPEKAEISGGLPIPYFLDSDYKDKLTVQGLLPPINWHTLMIIFTTAVVLMGVGLIESLMTLSLVDEITETRGRGNRECVGQGLANITCGFFGGMGGCAMIGQSLINVNSGGKNRLSGIVAALLLLAFILFLGPWIGMIPMAALVGVMFMVVIGTFEWATVKMFKRMPMADMIVMITVVLITVFRHNLALAVLVGVIMAALVFAWNHATHLFADIKHNEQGSKIYQLHGPLFFASVESFKALFNPAQDPDDVVIDFYYTRVYDQSGLEAINAIAEKYRAQNKRLHLVHLSEECAALLDKAGDMVEVNISEDPHYHVATDRLG